MVFTTNATFSSLKSNVDYSILVAAINTAGAGITSMINVTTLNTSMSNMTAVTCDATVTTTMSDVSAANVGSKGIEMNV